MQEEKIVAMSTIYQHGKTQVPSPIRKYLGFNDGDTVLYLQDVDEKIYIVKGDKLLRPRLRRGKYL